MTRTYWAIPLPYDKNAPVQEGCIPLLFRTRREARLRQQALHGYVKTRKDLRAAPHHWRLHEPIKLSVTMKREVRK